MEEDSLTDDRRDDRYQRHDDLAISRSSSSSSSSSFKLSYSVNSQSEYGFTQKSIEKSGKSLTYVQQLTMKFEKLSGDEKLKKTPKFSVGIFPWTNLDQNSQTRGIHEVPSEEEVDDISECDEVLAECDDMQEIDAQTPKTPIPDIFVDEFRDDSADSSDNSAYQSDVQSTLVGIRLSDVSKRVVEAKNRHVILKSLSFHPSSKVKEQRTTDDINTPKLRRNLCQIRTSKLDSPSASIDIPPIIDELVKTEESYVQNLKIGIENYGSIFEAKNIPAGLKGKKWVILGNVEQIAEFHETEFLPMLQRNSNDVKALFDEFSKFIDENCFYMYVIYTINKKYSLKLCEEHRDYFRKLQETLNDKLGINSFLVQPIQRLARYPLLLQQFITTCFKGGDIKYKPAIESCCKVEKRVRNLLTVTNESQELNDIEECNDIDVFYQGRFKKSNEFYVYDYTQRRGYRSKTFIFDKCLIYTEIKEKHLVFRGCYPSDHIGFVAKPKSFTLYYQKRKVQECDFSAEQNIIDHWIDLIRDMISLFAQEEKRKLTEKYSKVHEIYRRPGSVALFRNSSRISSDSGVGSLVNASIAPTEECSPRTTWYADNFTNSS